MRHIRAPQAALPGSFNPPPLPPPNIPHLKSPLELRLCHSRQWRPSLPVGAGATSGAASVGRRRNVRLPLPPLPVSRHFLCGGHFRFARGATSGCSSAMRLRLIRVFQGLLVGFKRSLRMRDIRVSRSSLPDFVFLLRVRHIRAFRSPYMGLRAPTAHAPHPGIAVSTSGFSHCIAHALHPGRTEPTSGFTGLNSACVTSGYSGTHFRVFGAHCACATSGYRGPHFRF